MSMEPVMTGSTMLAQYAQPKGQSALWIILAQGSKQGFKKPGERIP
jgi:hypothetical protein